MDGEVESKDEETAGICELLRFLQLMCENHNSDLQNFLRHQHNGKNKISFNIVLETLKFVDVYGLSLFINPHNVRNIVQALQTLTEYCQVNILGFCDFEPKRKKDLKKKKK